MSLIVRQASLNDLSAIMEFSRKAHDASITYAPLGYNSVIWRATLKQVMADPANVVLIAKEGLTVLGLLIGMKLPMPWSGGFCASDLVFVAFKGGDKLLKAFDEWCVLKRIRRADIGNSEPGKDEAKDRMFGGVGFKPAGRVYYKLYEEVAK